MPRKHGISVSNTGLSSNKQKFYNYSSFMNYIAL